jgi:fatty-acyl-CoA synthase
VSTRPQEWTVPTALEATAGEEATFTFVREDGTEQLWPLARLRLRAREVAAALCERGLAPGERVALILPEPEEFVPAFLGVMRAGGVPVPLYPPSAPGSLDGYLEAARHVVSAASAAYLVTGGASLSMLAPLAAAASLREVLSYSMLEGDAERAPAPPVDVDGTAFLQFTSGSTARPKGVVLTYRNIAANCHAIMVDALRVRPGDRGVSWLPLFHDMGLIGFVLAPILHRQSVSLLPPRAFVRNPLVWLKTISRHRGTVTFAPNFAYGLVTKRVRDGDLSELDLSSLRIAGCGAEPIQAETLSAFARRFAVCGFRADAFRPSYGLAESTLAVSIGHGISVDRVDREALARGWAEPSQRLDALELVGCGRAFPGHALRVVDPATGAPLPPRSVGEVVVRGPSVMQRYVGDATATDEARIGGWLRTGDLGYVADGQLVVCGRRKDLIVVAGRKYVPQDIEWAASAVQGVRAGGVVAFGLPAEGGEREPIVVLVEARRGAPAALVGPEVQRAVHRALALAVDRVVLLEPGALPKTSSGKLQRARARALYLAGAFDAPRPCRDVGAEPSGAPARELAGAPQSRR